MWNTHTSSDVLCLSTLRVHYSANILVMIVHWHWKLKTFYSTVKNLLSFTSVFWTIVRVPFSIAAFWKSMGETSRKRNLYSAYQKHKEWSKWEQELRTSLQKETEIKNLYGTAQRIQEIFSVLSAVFNVKCTAIACNRISVE